MSPLPAISFDRFDTLAKLMPHEQVTSVSRSFEEAEGLTAPILVLTLRNDSGGRRPNILGPNTLIRIGQAFEEVRQELAAQPDRYSAVVVASDGPAFVAGADLTMAKLVHGQQPAEEMAELGNIVFNILDELPVPTIAFVHGAAIGGGLELALAADHRAVSAGARNLSLPEAFLGLLPGWGGVYRLPHLIGPASALELMIDYPLSNNKVLDGTQAFERGIADVLLPEEDFYASALAWVIDQLKEGQLTTDRPLYEASSEEWAEALEKAEATVAKKTRGIPPAPERLLQVVAVSKLADQPTSTQEQVKALGELMNTHEFENTVYSYMDLLQKRAKRPAGAPDLGLARPIKKVGIIGAGLMATQLAVLFAQRLQVPVVLTDISEMAVHRGLGLVKHQLQRQADRGRLTVEKQRGIESLITGSADKSVFADADFVIEAVFEELEVKQQVLRDIEAVVTPDAILATNTSSLSVTEMASELQHPERLIGFHFFNPVAAMQLVEIVRTEDTNDVALATAFQLAADLRKSPILVKDATAFAVNRVLLRMMADVQRVFDEGSPAEVVDHAIDRFGLPMTPFELLALVGLPVAQHVTESLNKSFGDRFHVSKNVQALIDNDIDRIWVNDSSEKSIPEETAKLLKQGKKVRSSEEIQDIVFTGLAEEIGLLLQEGVVSGPEEVDLGMILGAGWPLYRGGITPFLDQEGYSQKVWGKPFHA